jgi:hypothetical protein
METSKLEALYELRAVVAGRSKNFSGLQTPQLRAFISETYKLGPNNFSWLLGES